MQAPNTNRQMLIQASQKTTVSLIHAGTTKSLLVLQSHTVFPQKYNSSFSEFAEVTLSSPKIYKMPKSTADLLERENHFCYISGFLPLQQASAMPWCHWNASMWKYYGNCSLQAIVQ